MKLTTWSAMVGLAAVGCATNISLAAIELVKWDIYNSTEYAAVDNASHTKDGGYAAVTPTTVVSNVTSSQITRGAGWGADTSHPAWQNQGAGLFVSHTGWTAKSLDAAVSGNQYFEMTVSAAAGYTLSLSTLGLSLYQQDLNAAATVVVEYSLNNFSTSTVLTSLSNIPNPWWGSVLANVSLSDQPALQNLTGPVTFRVYGYNFTGADAGLGRGGGSNTDARIVGDVVAVPEVASFGLLAAGVVSLTRSRRSARRWS